MKRKIKFNKHQTYEAPRSKMRRDGTSTRDRSDVFSRTKALYAPIQHKRPKIVAKHAYVSAVSSLEERARDRAYRSFLRQRPR
jgi:hypothetical protein